MVWDCDAACLEKEVYLTSHCLPLEAGEPQGRALGRGCCCLFLLLLRTLCGLAVKPAR